MTKQAISKLEQGEKINDKRLKEIAEALNVTFEGLKRYREMSLDKKIEQEIADAKAP